MYCEKCRKILLFKCAWYLQCVCVCLSVCWAETLEWRETGWQLLLRSHHGYHCPGTMLCWDCSTVLIKTQWNLGVHILVDCMLTHWHTFTAWRQPIWFSTERPVRKILLKAEINHHRIRCVRQRAMWSSCLCCLLSKALLGHLNLLGCEVQAEGSHERNSAGGHNQLFRQKPTVWRW